MIGKMRQEHPCRSAAAILNSGRKQSSPGSDITVKRVYLALGRSAAKMIQGDSEGLSAGPCFRRIAYVKARRGNVTKP